MSLTHDDDLVLTPAMQQHIRRMRQIGRWMVVVWTLVVFALGYWLGHTH